jgi:hypothetical protein
MYSAAVSGTAPAGNRPLTASSASTHTRSAAQRVVLPDQRCPSPSNRISFSKDELLPRNAEISDDFRNRRADFGLPKGVCDLFIGEAGFLQRRSRLKIDKAFYLRSDLRVSSIYVLRNYFRMQGSEDLIFFLSAPPENL